MLTSTISTERLTIRELQADDYPFIFELVNSPGWLAFIGDRNVRTVNDAQSYTAQIIAKTDTWYWTVQLKTTGEPIGIITLLKRDFLTAHDIGFALLPAYTGAGYSLEATRAVIDNLPENLPGNRLLAMTNPKNSRSIRLLEKLEFRLERSIEVEDKLWLQYSRSADQIQVNKITRSFFMVFDNTKQEPRFSLIDRICSPLASIVRKSAQLTEVYNLESFIAPRKKMLTDGTLTAFREFETEGVTQMAGQIAQRYSRYRKEGFLNGLYFEGTGHKFFHLVKENDGWKIVHVIWEDDV